jgi:hypothetical protein
MARLNDIYLNFLKAKEKEDGRGRRMTIGIFIKGILHEGERR